MLIPELQIPARRALQPIRDQLALVEPGELWSATFSSSRYGVFVIEGIVIRSAVDQHIGGTFIGSSTSVPADLHALRKLESATPVGAVLAPNEVSHGDILRLQIAYNERYTLTVLGTALRVEGGGTVVAGWLVEGDRVKAIERISSAEENERTLPPVLSRLTSTVLPGD